MAVENSLVLVIDPLGEVKHLVGEHDQVLSALGPVTDTWRNSRVDIWANVSDETKTKLATDEALWPEEEPNYTSSHSWWADMTPVGGPLLGPYVYYVEALIAEIHWLQDRNLPGLAKCQKSTTSTS